MKARDARKIARDAHAETNSWCCGIKFTSKLALAMHKRDHKKQYKNRLYPD